MEDKEYLTSIVARHESFNYLHALILSFHGVWAVFCWFLFVGQWIFAKGTSAHKLIGKFILFGFLVPLELTGLILCPYLLVNIQRDNILLSSGYLVVPSMGFLFLVTTYDSFKSIQFKCLKIVREIVNIANIILQNIGTGVLFYKIFFGTDTGIEHENNVELLLLTAPFTFIQMYLTAKRYNFGHVFYIKYLTLQMFPGSMIVIARDSYWLWGENGLQSVWVRILLANLPMLPFYYMAFTEFRRHQKQIKSVKRLEKTDLQEKNGKISREEMLREQLEKKRY